MRMYDLRMVRDPYANMTDVEVLASMREHLIKASTLPPGSVERAIAWAVFDSAKMELDRRMCRHVLAKLAEADDEAE